MAERRERILAAAREIIATSGYAAFSMRDLARHSRVTVPTIYNLIGSKDEVLFAAVEEQIARFVAGIEQAGDASPVEQILSVHQSCVRELLRLPRYYRSLLMLVLTSDSATRVRLRVAQAFAVELARGIDALARANALADWVEPTALGALLQRNLNIAALQWASGELSDTRLRPVALYGACCILAGVSDGASRSEFTRRAARLQSVTRVRRAAKSLAQFTRGAPKRKR
jgi:AcrR family transcriptional regulator